MKRGLKVLCFGQYSTLVTMPLDEKRIERFFSPVHTACPCNPLLDEKRIESYYFSHNLVSCRFTVSMKRGLKVKHMPVDIGCWIGVSSMKRGLKVCAFEQITKPLL